MTTSGDMGAAPMVKVGAEAPLRRKKIIKNRIKKMKTFKEYIVESLDDVAKLIRGALKKEGISFKETKKIGFIKFTIGKADIVWDGVGIDLKENRKSIYYLSGKPKLQYKDIVNKLIDRDLVESTLDEKEGSEFSYTAKISKSDANKVAISYGSEWDKDGSLWLIYDKKKHIMTYNLKKGELYSNFKDDYIINMIKEVS